MATLKGPFIRLILTVAYMNNFFWWLNLVRFHSLYKILYPKGRIESYSIMSTRVSPNKVLLI